MNNYIYVFADGTKVPGIELSDARHVEITDENIVLVLGVVIGQMLNKELTDIEVKNIEEKKEEKELDA